jgi:hypothetical protein
MAKRVKRKPKRKSKPSRKQIDAALRFQAPLGPKPGRS